MRKGIKKDMEEGGTDRMERMPGEKKEKRNPLWDKQPEGAGSLHGIVFRRLQLAMLVFVLLAVVLLVERLNIRYEGAEASLELLPEEAFGEAAGQGDSEEETGEDGPDGLAGMSGGCLLVADSNGEKSREMAVEFCKIAGQMKFGVVQADLAEEPLPELEGYERIVLALESFSSLGEDVVRVFDWVEKGGNLLVLNMPQPDAYLQLVSGKMGILDCGTAMYTVEGLEFQSGFMIAGEGKTLGVSDAYPSSVPVVLNENSKVHLTSSGERKIPLIWETKYREGKVVVDNLSFFEKVYRGFYAASYSLLGDCCVYPVINASTFYVDDFPSPVPQGESEYITRDYGMDVSAFYTNVWWPDMCSFYETYGIRPTGMVIEEYSDQVSAPYERNGDMHRYRYFGNKILDLGGEIGFHGYNHMPLVLSNFDYKDKFDGYKPWSSPEDMRLGVQELADFCQWLFPEETFQVYVPPSNILSEEGRSMLKEDFPQIRAIASIYFEGEFEYSQDYCVAEDGMIETPRVVSGCNLDEYMETAVVSELNLHYVNSHFLHPDDLLDVDRGAELGWKVLKETFGDYLEWLYTSAPDIRNLTGSGMAAAVQRFYYVQPSVTEEKNEIRIQLSGFADSAELFVRINEGNPSGCEGGELTPVAEKLYLLSARQSQVVISLEEEARE